MESVKTLSLNIIELFSSVQGETSTSGRPCTFVRLARCNLRCSWCDSEYSFKKGSPYTLLDILDFVKSQGFKEVCITGGEPLLQKNVYPLIRTLCDEGYSVQIETGGSLPIKEIDKRACVILDIKCPGSGMHEKNLWSNFEHLKPHDEVKFVLKNRLDYDYAKKCIAQYSLSDSKVEVLLSPVFDVLDPKEIISWIQKDQLHFVRLNLQIHKFIWEPHTIGV